MDTGDVVVAWASTKQGSDTTPDDLRKHCEALGLPSFQMPEIFEVTTNELPMHGGKVAKKLLRTPAYVRSHLAETLIDALERLDAPGSTSTWEQKALVLFERLDGDSSGFLSVDELRAVVDDKSAKVLKLADTTLDGQIDPLEWITALKAIPDASRENVLEEMASVLAFFEKDQRTAQL